VEVGPTIPLDGEIRDGRHFFTVRVYYEDTDFTGIVYHANYLRYMERGRTNYLRLIGADHRALFEVAEKEAPGFAFVVRSMTLDFLRPARMDDVLEVVTEPQEVLGASVTRRRAFGRRERAGCLHQRRAGAAHSQGFARRDERGSRQHAVIGSAGEGAPPYIRLMSEHDSADPGFALFETTIGRCAIVWSERGISGVQFPEGSEQATRNRLQRRFPNAREAAAPPAVRHTIAEITALLAGERRDLSDAVLDCAAVPDFNRRVYDVARAIPPGSTLSYGEVAERLGDRGLAREVAQALGQNPFPIIVPCHRVMAAGGKTGGFSAPGGVRTKLKLLSIERAQPSGPTLFDDLPLATRPRRRA
jgi:methylated-DNA-[protein]-cysteine S-methyltransferase